MDDFLLNFTLVNFERSIFIYYVWANHATW